MFFWNSLAFSMIQWMLAVWSLVPLPFLKPAWTSGSVGFHILLKPGLKNFEHYFASVWDERNCSVVWAFFGIGMKTDLFQSCGHCWVFQICWHFECSTSTASSFRICSSSTGISSPPLVFFEVILSKCTDMYTYTYIYTYTWDCSGHLRGYVRSRVVKELFY